VCLSSSELPSSIDPYKSCIIEDLIAERVPDRLDRMAILVGLLRQIQEICLNRSVMHLAMARKLGARWYTGLLTAAGFRHCECDRPGELVAGSPTCFPLDQLSINREQRFITVAKSEPSESSSLQLGSSSPLLNPNQVDTPFPRATSVPYYALTRASEPACPQPYFSKKEYCK